MNRLYGCLIWAVLLFALSACGEDRRSAEFSDDNKEKVAAPPVAQSVSAVQEAVPEGPPAIPVDPGQDSVPPADQPPPAD